MTIDVKVTYKNDKLKTLRRAAGLSQAQLGEMTGLNFRTLQHYEQGTKDLNAAKLQTLLKLCNALNCALSDIITDPDVLELLAVYERKRESADIQALDAERKKPFIAPEGKFCPKDCGRRGSVIKGPQAAKPFVDPLAGGPWCFEYATELEWQDKKTGLCRKCEKCAAKQAGEK